jgi:hypothetical protein
VNALKRIPIDDLIFFIFNRRAKARKYALCSVIARSEATPVIARSEATKQPPQTSIRPIVYNSLSFNLSAFSATINWSMADWISPFIKADRL